jgi:hypothetical protein
LYNADSLVREINMIKCPDIQRFTRNILGKALPYFWSVGSSSTGKYHPEQSNGEGGLVRHTMATAYFAKEFSACFGLAGRDADLAVAAAILHDICKYGIPGGKHTTNIHDKESADYVMALGKAYIATPEAGTFTAADLVEICKGIAFHMGTWTKHERKKEFPYEYSRIELCVHMADMASSRKEVKLAYLEEPTVGVG